VSLDSSLAVAGKTMEKVAVEKVAVEKVAIMTVAVMKLTGKATRSTRLKSSATHRMPDSNTKLSSEQQRYGNKNSRSA
jgi:hypothetical protein